jgi:hypothetical protein
MPTYNTPLRGVSLSDAAAEAMATAPVDDPYLYTLEITHEDLAAPIRLVLNSSNITATLEADAPFNAGAAVEFTAIDLGLHLPEESDGQAGPPTRFWIDGVSAIVATALEPAAESLAPVSVSVPPKPCSVSSKSLPVTVSAPARTRPSTLPGVGPSQRA